MGRGMGAVELVHEFLPEWTAIVFGLLTQLGDIWFLGLVVGAFYLAERENPPEGAVVLGLFVTGLAVLSVLKSAFALPRPDQPIADPTAYPPLLEILLELIATADGYGFPSGHAFMTTVVYLAIAKRLSIGSPRHRYGGAVGLVLLVSLTRVALGVHFIVDLLGGIAGGLVLLRAVELAVDRWPTRRGTVVLIPALVVSGIDVVVTGTTATMIVLGAAIGLGSAWYVVGAPDPPGAWSARFRDRRFVAAIASGILLLAGSTIFVRPGDVLLAAAVAVAVAIFVSFPSIWSRYDGGATARNRGV